MRRDDRDVDSADAPFLTRHINLEKSATESADGNLTSGPAREILCGPQFLVPSRIVEVRDS